MTPKPGSKIDPMMPPHAAPPRRPDRSSRVHFRMWRSPRPTPDCEFFGTVRVPAQAKPGDVLAIEAYVVEAEPMAGQRTGQRGLEGTVSLAVAHMVRTGRLEGDRRALPQPFADLVDQAEAQPFDDSLEGIGR